MFFSLAVLGLLCLLALSAYIDRLYAETGKFLSRENPANVDAWESFVEPRLRLGSESAALSASVLRQMSIGGLSFLLAMRLFEHRGLAGALGRSLSSAQVWRTVFELLLVLLVFDRLIPHVLFTRTRGRWIVRLTPLIQVLFYVILPVTLTIGLLLSIAGLASPEAGEPEHPGEGVDALLEAGEEEGILEESDRELVRNVVEFGDKVVREVMTPRPEMFAVPGSLSLAEFTAAVNEHNLSRVPVYVGSLDDITGIAFARDLLHVHDVEAQRRAVSQIQRPAAFVPETKKVNELLREMQREKQHMSIVIDEYGAVAGLVTIEDLLEAIVGNIEDEHDVADAEDAPVAEGERAFLVSGSFEVSRLRDLFNASIAQLRGAQMRAVQPRGFQSRGVQSRPGNEPDPQTAAGDRFGDNETDLEQQLAAVLNGYDASTVGGLVSEMAGHIPLPGEVVEDGPLRLEVLASTDRRVERVRVLLGTAGAGSEPE